MKPFDPEESDDCEIPGLFRQSSRVSPADLDALSGLRPLEDRVFQYVFGEVVEGRIPLYLGAVPLSLIEPYDKHYHPENHPVGKEAIDQAFTAALRGKFSKMWIYPSGDKYIMADDYIPYAAALRGQPDFIPCWIMGNVCLQGVENFQGPISPSDIKKRILGWE